jgi:AcrR family transcriptional regulator
MASVSTAKRKTPVARIKRTRSRGLSTLHQEQIEDSRKRILSAAKETFTANSYVGTTVDMIITGAGVGRSTFYKHFVSKFDVAKGILNSYVPRLHAVFDQLPDQPDAAQALAWLRTLMQLYRDNRDYMVLFYAVSGAEPEFFPEMMAIHNNLLRTLGTRIPAFAKASSGQPQHAHLHVRAHMHIMHAFSFCSTVVSDGWDVDVEAGLAYLGEELARFISENR